MKKFKEFINENIKSILKGKSDEDVIEQLKKLDNNERIQKIIELQSYWELLPRDLKGVCIFFGDLILNGDEGHNKLEFLPPDFIVTGDLDVSYNEIRYLPKNLIVKGDLDCTDNQLTEIPKDLIVGGILYIEYNYIKEIPETINASAIICSRQDLVPKKKVKKPKNFTGKFIN